MYVTYSDPTPIRCDWKDYISCRLYDLLDNLFSGLRAGFVWVSTKFWLVRDCYLYIRRYWTLLCVAVHIISCLRKLKLEEYNITTRGPIAS